MAANTTGTIMRQPEDGNIRLWRYMDFSKFVALISSKSLFLNRVDRFTDPYEGHFSSLNNRIRNSIYEAQYAGSEIDPHKVANAISDFNSFSRQWTYVNCWHANKYESAAMWDLYAKTEEAIAIETDYNSLAVVLPSDAQLGLVEYIDFDTEWMPENNTTYPFVHKRKSFEHEKEVRIIVQEIPRAKSGVGFDWEAVNDKHGISLDIDLNQLIKSIHVSPTAPKWLVDLTNTVSKTFGIDAHVKQSDLYKAPIK
ncbi:DUF2971 domain-containing protein [Shewanella oneidensis MR-1]|uniref:DUF2971 domain-containing protein n=1 Tax=Shewanella oneidensis (strain ATCC 700550 / JCM 31522 / CIP 106686 / LMG 19005 / NCIMB 14063 / MR-1) TaxID=211586 RepID=Q8E995_SHEON|nr:DUF2971 domain-containing protein [Shewanella oneidensis]AAN57358.2 protein of unknown function DUF2971 [Shewanella oneidensis MR-1]MDX5998336.1 DUF2971 domain-containing protein [Shewanella oneidensis]MEE2029152.1 hypothetical protein [Shewanella oneidensis]QKG94692.1 DUF2971 domain-containing protein [Shewanella oneidensis MR-1]